MAGKKLIILFLFFISGVLSFDISGQWYQKDFMIGTFCDPSVSIVENEISNSYVENAKLAQAAYFNLFTDTRNEFVDISNYLKLVRIHDSLGINTLYKLGHGSAYFHSKLGTITQYELANSNIFGWYLRDEPPLVESGNIISIVNSLQNIPASKPAYINLLPIYAFETISEYESYLDAYLRDSTLKIVSYDFYPFHKKFVQNNYYKNLQLITERAKKRPVWIYPLTTEHSTYLDPERYHLNFMVFSPITYGVKGIVYYTYETIIKSVNYNYESALLDTMHYPTSKYFIVKDINRFVSKVAGPIIMNSIRIGTYHVSGAPFVNETIDEEYLLNDVTPLISTISNTNIVTGIFKSTSDTSAYYLFMHNKKDQTFNNVYVSLKGNHQNNISVSVPVEDFGSNSDTFTISDTHFNSTYNETSFYVDFKPGELRIVKVSGVDTLFIKRSEYNLELSVVPNPVYDLIETRFVLSDNAAINLNLVSQNGTLTKSLLSNNFLNKGTHVRSFNISGLSNGIYIVQLVAGGKAVSSKILKF